MAKGMEHYDLVLHGRLISLPVKKGTTTKTGGTLPGE